MFGYKKELQYQARIKELENIICPAEQHDFHVVDEIEHIIPAGTSADIEYTERVSIMENVLEKRKRVERELIELLADAEILSNSCKDALVALQSVHTEEDAQAFDEKFAERVHYGYVYKHLELV